MPHALDIAYFSMEVGLRSDIPTFAGGLGILAGDLLKAAADEGLACAGVTGCWRTGYLHQEVLPGGAQRYTEASWDPAAHMVRVPETVTVLVEGRTVHVGAWRYDVVSRSTVPVYFLDTNLPENAPVDRDITHHLYGGDQAMRVRQELVLGVGGVRLLRALGYDTIHNFHLNEGHCAFLTLELLRERGFSDDAVRASCAFTTHTPVQAGHDVFPYDLAWHVCGDALPWHIKRLAGEDALSMTRLAMTLSHATFGVSKLHAEVSRRMLGNPAILPITNGVHHVDWCSVEMAALFDRHIHDWRLDARQLASHAAQLPDAELWTAHQVAKRRLITHANQHALRPLREDVLTIVAARRIVPYKRTELLYDNLQRLREVGGGKLQIIHAGNTHPHDAFSQDVVRHLASYAEALQDSVSIVYLPNYNPDLARMLVAGADVWLNTPMRLHEASGTSGMKAALNGVPNLSTLDGWWIEGYAQDPESGWRIGPVAEALPPDAMRHVDAEDLYTQLQYEVLPAYDAPGNADWLGRMKRAIALLGTFSAQRCIREHVSLAWTHRDPSGAAAPLSLNPQQ